MNACSLFSHSGSDFRLPKELVNVARRKSFGKDHFYMLLIAVSKNAVRREEFSFDFLAAQKFLEMA